MASDFTMQSATTLANGGYWQDYNLTPTESNDQNFATITPTGSHGFFRLRRPEATTGMADTEPKRFEFSLRLLVETWLD
jgi:hypothetical protein